MNREQIIQALDFALDDDLDEDDELIPLMNPAIHDEDHCKYSGS